VDEHYTGSQHSIALVVNDIMQKAAAISFLEDNVRLNVSGLFGKYVCIHCFDYSLVLTFANKTLVSSSLWYRSKNVKAEAILCVLRAPVSILGNQLAQNLR
jgi:hypothetical protein